MKKLQLLLVFAFLFVGSSMLLAQTVVKAELDGGNEAPEKIISAATADVIYNVYSDRIEFSVRLRQFGTDVNQIHVHLAPEGLAGPIILNMYNRTMHGALEGVDSIEGATFYGVSTVEDVTPRITNDLRMRGIRNFADVRAALLNPAALTYTNVHTMSVPGGEIRGQNRLLIEPVR
jgi:CHRD domain